MADKSVRDRYSKKTLNATLEKLKVYGVTSVVRPTGFGKSYMLAKITSQKFRNKPVYKRCLYIYPLDIIKKDIQKKYGPDAPGDVHLQNTEFISYQALNNIREKGYQVKKGGVLTLEEYIQQYDLVMCDECHLCGSEGFKACWERIKDLFGVDKIHLIGVTASPRRMDSFDVIGEIFGGEDQAVFSLTENEAYRLGILTPPVRCVAIYNTLDFKKSVMNKLKESDNVEKKDEKDMLLRLEKITGAEKIIYQVIDKVRPDIKYMKFIVFYVNKQDLFSKKDMVSGWFTDIYSSYGFKVSDHIIVSSVDSELCSEDDSKLLDGFKEISSLTEQDYKIDLIHCIDMLNMGYHVDDMTGIVMLRGTRSEIIEKQQIGRCLSVNAKHPPIIFDFVDNYNTKKWFKNEADRRDVETVDINSMRSVGDYDLKSTKDVDGVEVYMSGYTVAALKEMDTIMNKKALRGKYNADDIVFWYKTLKAPIYIIAANFGKTYDEMVQILKGLGMNLQYEDEVDLRVSILKKLDKAYGRPEAEQYSILNSIFENPKVPDNEMKLYLSKKALQ